MSSSAEYVFNPDVELTNERKIAIRGLTRNHYGKRFDLGEEYGGGVITRVRNRGNATEVSYIEDGSGRARIVTCEDPLAVITVIDK